MSKLSLGPGWVKPLGPAPIEAFGPAPGVRSLRWAAALALRVASMALARAARRLQAARAQHEALGSEPMYEFYAEAGAPEGALYVGGQLVGYVEGVRRL